MSVRTITVTIAWKGPIIYKVMKIKKFFFHEREREREDRGSDKGGGLGGGWGEERPAGQPSKQDGLESG